MYQDVLLSQRKVSVWLKCQVVLDVAVCKHAACQYSPLFYNAIRSSPRQFCGCSSSLSGEEALCRELLKMSMLPLV